MALLGMCCLSFSADAQQPVGVDTLLQQLEKASTDSTKLQTYFRIAWAYFRHDVSESRGYVNQAISLSEHINDSASTYRGYYYLGLINRLESNYDSALQYFQKVYDYRMHTGQASETDNVLFNMGVVTSYKGWYDKSLEYYLRALQVAEESGDRFMEAEILNSAGLIHKKLKNYAQSLDMTKASLQIFEQLGVKAQQANCLGNLGSTFAEMQQFDSALLYYQNAYEINKTENSIWGMAHCLRDMGLIYSELGQYETALENMLQSLEIREKLNNKKEIAESLVAIASLYNKTQQPGKGLGFAQRAREIATTIDARQELREAHKALAEAYAGMGRYEQAYASQKAITSINDSLYSTEITRQINELQAKYETEKKEKEIALLTQEREVQKAVLAQKSTLLNAFIIGCILLLALILVTILFYRSKMKSKALIAHKNEEINQRKIQELEQQQKLVSMDAMVTGQEEERKRIAKDLHDGLGSLLANIQMRFSALETDKGNGNTKLYQQANTLLDEACNEVRKIAHNMMPGALMKFGLVPAIRDICHAIEKNSGISVDFQIYGIEDRFEEKVEISLYRIVQELLNNVLKHAQATEVIVQMSLHKDMLHLTVEDNGTGFDIEAAKAKGGLGMRSLQSRVQYISGTLEIDSVPEAGTTVTVDVPVGRKTVEMMEEWNGGRME